MNALLANAGNVNSLIQYEVATPDGTSVKRMTVRALHKHRADLDARKAAFERVVFGAHALEVQLSRITRALKALATPDEQMAAATVVTSPRNRGDVGPYQSPQLDKPIASTRAPPGARQQWQLYRAREASRDLELTAPMVGGYVRFVRIQCLGGDPARLQFDRLTREQLARLEEPIRYIRGEWQRFQMMRDVGGNGTVHSPARGLGAPPRRR